MNKVLSIVSIAFMLYKNLKLLKVQDTKECIYKPSIASLISLVMKITQYRKAEGYTSKKLFLAKMIH